MYDLSQYDKHSDKRRWFRFWVAALTITAVLLTTGLSFSANAAGNRATQMLRPVVKIVDTRGYGSGVVFKNDEKGTYILTAWHVVSSGDEVRVGWWNGEKYDVHTGTVTYFEEPQDLAVVFVPNVHARTAALARDYTPRVFDEVWKVGAGIGHPPFPTRGVVSLPRVPEYGVDYMMVTAPVVNGDSGGGVFVLRNGRYELIGLVDSLGDVKTAIPMTPYLSQLLVWHIAYIKPMSRVVPFLRRAGFKNEKSA